MAEVNLETSAKSAVLLEPESGKILFEKNAHAHVAPASVTKLMTLLVAFDAIDQGKVGLQDKVVTSQRAFEMGGSQIYLEPGEEMGMQDLLMSIAVQSANDACVAVAEHVSGSYEGFVDEMNKKAASLGLKNTHFVNPHGLPAEDHYTSAYDMAIIAKEALKYPKLREMAATRHYKIRGDSAKPMLLDNHNKLLWWYAGTDGFKTGWTSEANFCLASTVERDRLRLVATVFGVPEMRGHFKESMKLFNYGFSKYRFFPVAEKQHPLAQVKVAKGEKDTVAVVPLGTPGVMVERGKDKNIEAYTEVVDSVNAPVEAGQKLGELVVVQQGQEMRRVDLVAQEAVRKDTLGGQMEKIWQRMYAVQ
ncbi:D-alanyl-D-alanine carboxypeptidase family protein [Heliophilum fasciatum]